MATRVEEQLEEIARSSTFQLGHAEILFGHSGIRSGDTFADLKAAFDLMVESVKELKEEFTETAVKTPVFIVDLNQEGMKLNYPLFVLIEEWPEEVIARSPELQVIARGGTENDALLAFKQEIVAFYNELKSAPPNNPGPAVLAIQSAMRALISE